MSDILSIFHPQNGDDIDLSFQRGDITALLVNMANIPAISPFVAAFIQNQRRDRMIELLEHLRRRLQDLEAKLPVDINKEDAEYFLSHALRSASMPKTSSERLKYLGTFVANSVMVRDFDFYYKKTLLAILEDLNDVQIILLNSFGLPLKMREAFQMKHPSVFPVTEALVENPVRFSAFMGIWQGELRNLGLLEPNTSHTSQVGVDLLNFIGI